LILALDFSRLSEALEMARSTARWVGMFKINIHLFTAAGPEAVHKIGALGPGIFLDLKYHDIPNTVAGAVSAASELPNVRLLDLHATGGAAMMRAGAQALAQNSHTRHHPKLLGITILTSLEQAELRRVGISGTPGSRALSLARLAKRCGLDGIVASPKEVRQIRRGCGRDFLIVVPGIRPHGGPSRSDDQARVATPAETIRAGADYLVVGRPITAAADPPSAARAISEEIAAALQAG
jgi:orotidine-5'-phosphate decarboxylase